MLKSVFFLCYLPAMVICHSLFVQKSTEKRLHDLEEKLKLETEERRVLQDFITSKLFLIDRRFAMMRGTLDSDHEPSSVYVRWGRTVCPGNGTELIYKGYIGGGHYKTGSGANIVCLPENPTWGNYDDSANSLRGHIYGAELDVIDELFGKPMLNEDMPCAVCKTPRSVTHMFPARANCFPGWTQEYTGYLVSNYHGRSISMDYNCVDGDPEAVPGGGSEDNYCVLYPVEVKCGSLPCPPYVDGREVACTVCSK